MNIKHAAPVKILLSALLLSVTMPAALAQGDIQLNKIWELSGFKQPESVLYDAKRDVVYVSNIEGDLVGKDGKGFISRVSLTGKLLEEKWITGLNAPKGMALSGNTLYVADIDRLVEIDLIKGQVAKKRRLPEAKFLNDVSADKKGRIYVSDTMGNTLYRLANHQFKAWVKSDALASPNGLYAEQDRLIVGAWGVMTEGFKTSVAGHLKTISFKDKEIGDLGNAQPVANVDGVEADGEGNYFVTDWMAGTLLHITPQGEAQPLLELGQGSADLDYIKDKKMLLIPLMTSGQLLAFEVKK